MTANTQHIIIREKWRCWLLLLLLLLSACSDYEYSIYDPLSPNYIDKDAPVAEEVDLGLSVNWASWNVGATAPEEYGGYYAWGEVKMRDNYTKGFYSYYNGDYNIDIGKNISGTSYDVAHVKWGNGWRMPTENEFEELCNKCSWTYIVLLPDSIAGYLVGGPNGNSLFLPMTGYYVNKRLSFQDSYGCYWSGTSWGDFSNPYGLHIKSSKNSMYPYSVSIDLPRYYGLSVRPVRDKEFKMSIAELLKTGEGTAATVQGTIVAKHTRGILLYDETGYILVNMEEESGDTRHTASNNATRSASSYTEGDVVTVEGVVTSDAGLLQFPSTSKTQKVGSAEVVHPEPEAWNGAAFYNYFDNISIRYVKYTGVLSKEGNDYIVTVLDSAITAVGQITYPASDLVDANDEGEEVQVIGYAIGYTDEKHVRTMVTSVKVVGQSIDETAVAEAVDLGLSVKWASWNVGATAPEEYGGYYAWGETEVKSDYSSSTYKWYDRKGRITKYCTDSDYGTVDNKTILDPEDDVANVKWGDGWRMPTLDEIQELVSTCYWEWTAVNGVYGYRISGNENFIFLPATDHRIGTGGFDRGSFGYYWSGSLGVGEGANYLLIGVDGRIWGEGSFNRNAGFTIRPVTDKNIVKEEPIVETIEGVLASGEGKTVKTQGSIVATHAQGILLHDKTGYIHVRLDANTDNVVGDVVTVKGYLIPRNGLLEFAAKATIEKVGTAEVVHPEPVVWDGAALDSYLTSPIIQYVQYTGVLSKEDDDYIVTVSDSVTTAVGQITYPASDLVDANDEGREVQVIGYAIGYTDDKYVRTMVTFVRLVIDETAVAEAVDLGLSVKWASWNVGATAPEEYGGYYAWGETEVKDNYDWSTYKWCNGDSYSYSMTKYCIDSDYGTVDNKTMLDPEDDVAYVKWGGAWRMPTFAEFEELRNNCSLEWTTVNGVNGFTISGNGNSIFLPAAGECLRTEVGSRGSVGYYWSGSLYIYNNVVCHIYFDSYLYGSNYFSFGRCRGVTIRPVQDY